MKTAKRKNKVSKKIPLTRSENMSRIHSNDTSIEILIRKELYRRGLRYRKNDRSVFGKPDIVFKQKKIAVFCDSEFWHGKDYLNGSKPKSNTDYWISKIERNIARDKEVNRKLESEGWTVIRLWGREILKNLTGCADKIVSALNKEPT